MGFDREINDRYKHDESHSRPPVKSSDGYVEREKKKTESGRDEGGEIERYYLDSERYGGRASGR